MLLSSAAAFRALPRQFRRATRKIALRAYRGCRRSFARILALSSWLNWCYTLNLNSMMSPPCTT